MTYDAAAWTGREPLRRFPLYSFVLQTPMFALSVGPMHDLDAFGVRLLWGRVPAPLEFDLAYLHERRWVWWTAKEWRYG